MTKQRSGRGSKMGAGAKKSRQQRKTGKSWLNLPNKWSYFKEESDETYKLDILPYVVKKMKQHPEFEAMQEDVWFRFPYRLHRNIGPKRTAMLCPETIGKKCPICDKMRKMYDDPDINNKKAAKFAPGRRSLFVVKIKRGGDKKLRGKTFIWDIADGNFYKEVDKEIDMGKDDWNNFACLQGGYTISARFAEEKFDKTKFPKCDRVDFKPRKDYDEKILKKNPCLDDMVVPNIPTYEEVKKAMENNKNDKNGKKENESNSANLDWSDIEDMDESELIEVMEDLGEDIDDLEYDDENELRELVATELDIEKEDITDSDKNNKSSDDNDLPDIDDLEDMDYDGLVEIVEENEMLSDNIDMDDYGDEDDDEDDLREAIEDILKDLGDESDNDDDPSLLEQIEDAEKIKVLKTLVKENDEFKKLRSKLKNFKDKNLTKLQKKMVKALKKPGSKSGKKTGSTKNALKCPFAYDYGKEWGEHDECSKKECKEYNKCFKVYDKMQDDE